MRPISLNVDAYGTYARRSFVADYLEVYAWKRDTSVRDLADLLKDRGLRLPEERFVPLSELDEGDDDSSDAALVGSSERPTERADNRSKEDAHAVFTILEERQRILGKLYPYQVNGHLLTRSNKQVTSYDVALALALRHACRDESVEYEFEAFVEACLRARHWLVFPFGKHVRGQPKSGVVRFRAVFQSAQKQLRLHDRRQGEVPRKVHDRGADILARVPPADPRPGCSTYIFQATVAQSQKWDEKLDETPQDDWRDYLGDHTMPLVALAIPHHAELEHLRELVKNGRARTVWDRLRLVAHQPKLEPAVLAQAKTIFQQGAEW